MLRNHLAAALRNLQHSRVYSGISIVGLAVGLAAAILCGLVVVQQLRYDAFMPGHERTYLCVSVLRPAGREPDYNAYSHSSAARLLKLDFPGIEATARLADEEIVLRRGRTQTRERIYWADPGIFDVLPLPVRQGDLRTALRQPDSVVLTRSVAAKYFGDEDPLGRTLDVGVGHPMTVTAVLEDLPANGSMLQHGIFASGLTASSELTRLDAAPQGEGFQITVQTFVRLKAGAAIEPIQAAMPELLERLWPRRPPGLGATMQLVRIDRVHLFAGLNPGTRARLTATALVGLLVLFVAVINFVNLSTARAARRAREVAVRKACGADDATLIAAFIGEALLYVMLACVLAVSLAEWLLPQVNAFLDTGATFEYWHQPAILAWIALGGFIIGVTSGVHPAFVLAAFRPAQALRGVTASGTPAGTLRYALVTAQFAILICMVIAAAVTYRQRQYATGDALRVATDQVLILEAPCTSALKGELVRLAGVRAVTCTGRELLTDQVFGNVRLKDGGAVAVSAYAVDSDLPAVYGLRLSAGRFLPQGSDAEDPASGAGAAPLRHFVINEVAARALGFASPLAAVGQRLDLPIGAYNAGTIIGVIPDFSLASVAQRIKPAAYYLAPRSFELINIKLSGLQLPATLGSIDELWSAAAALRAGQDSTVSHRYFLKDHLAALYRPLLRDAQLFALFAGLAILLACLGLIGLTSASIARRTREIGVRKAMGASTGEILRLLLWQHVRPVLWASLIAWPVVGLAMSRWLEGFAYHVPLEPWLFAVATAIAVVVALLTVSTQCYLLARTRPVNALRYE